MKFSYKSRQRLQRLLASINQERAGLPVFLTLTYPAKWPKDPKVWKRHLDNFLKRLATDGEHARYPVTWGVWRVELQKRGAPHFHLLLFGGPQLVDVMKVYNKQRKRWSYIGNPKHERNLELYRWISRNWYEVVGSGDEKHLAAGTRIEPIQSWNGVMFYASKYVAKIDENEKDVPLGRHWGIIHRKLFAVDEMSYALTDLDFVKIKRVLRKRMEKIKGCRVKSLPFSGLHTFLPANDLIRLLTWAYRESYLCGVVETYSIGEAVSGGYRKHLDVESES